MFYLYHTSCSAVSPSKCFKLKSASKTFVSALQRRSEGTGTGTRTQVARLVFSPHLPPPLLPCILAPAPPPPLDGVAILWSLLRQRWSRPACLKCSQMQIDLSSRVWEAQLGTDAPFLTPFPQNPAWKGEFKKKNLTSVVFVWFHPALVSGCCLLCSANISYLACSFFFGCIWNNDVILIFFLFFFSSRRRSVPESSHSGMEEQS